MPSAPGDPGISRLVSITLSHRSAPGAEAPSAGAATPAAVTRRRWARALAARVVPVTCLAA
ncbi:MAG TPA: hypothetical protein VFQ68_02340 [Streptosporangiaceae bacterium]|nr:hypothetical protein [Streptosporangiaceae bacterium]